MTDVPDGEAGQLHVISRETRKLGAASPEVDENENNVRLETRGYGSFTVGAEVIRPSGSVRLELCLSDVPGTPESFTENEFG